MGNPNSMTVAVLLYGDYPELAERCLGSIVTNAFQLCPTNLRIGMNECSPRTKRYVRGLVQNNLVAEENIYESNENIKKYPMMRRMLYDDSNPITTEYVMWFDDDSFIVGPQFLPEVRRALGPNAEQREPDMLGAVYTIKLGGGQEDFIKDQPWYCNKPISRNMRFATGGWWVLKSKLIEKFNYPWPNLLHRGGDVMFGALVEQQGLWLRQYRSGIAINADDEGRESHAKRRGFDEKPLGFVYQKGQVRLPPQAEQPILPNHDVTPPQPPTPPQPKQQKMPAAPIKAKRPVMDLDL